MSGNYLCSVLGTWTAQIQSLIFSPRLLPWLGLLSNNLICIASLPPTAPFQAKPLESLLRRVPTALTHTKDQSEIVFFCYFIFQIEPQNSLASPGKCLGCLINSSLPSHVASGPSPLGSILFPMANPYRCCLLQSSQTQACAYCLPFLHCPLSEKLESSLRPKDRIWGWLYFACMQCRT